ncbi:MULTISPECIES: cation diffusion facilitator family transporter [Hydrocarboniphaga]|jgi:cobalt-zinc-cadmium efflux system protein|nr:MULTISPECIES: cation diffusion facilitator family transporter [Hydrocarboniphaga]MDZ4079792.1 cation diffusion facilitator family transporter [Hydrocarboniphaga sp.]
MGAGHDHGKGANERSMWIALSLTGSFMIAEAVGGWLTGSLALISDAAHMLTDTVALAIALLAIRIGKRAADRRRTFGYGRFEIIAAAFNAGMLFAVAIYIFYEAWQRFRMPPEVQSIPMLVIASLGLIVNLISMRLLSAGQSESLNVKGAYLEVWSDMLGSLGVIIGAGVIYLTGWTWFDPLIAVLIAVWVLPRTYILLKASANVLLEGVPEGVEIDKIESSIRSDADVRGVHDLHIWGLGSGQISLAAHVLLAPGVQVDSFLRRTEMKLKSEYKVTHTTLQCEFEPCADEDICSLSTNVHDRDDEHDHHSHA